MADTREAQEVAERCASHMYSQDRAAHAMGIEIESIMPGSSTLKMEVHEDMINGHGICHGGKIFSLADSAFSYACNSENQAAVAAGCTIDFIFPAKQGDILTAEAKVVHQGARSGIYQVSVFNQERRLIAFFKGNSARIKRPVLDC